MEHIEWVLCSKEIDKVLQKMIEKYFFLFKLKRKNNINPTFYPFSKFCNLNVLYKHEVDELDLSREFILRSKSKFFNLEKYKVIGYSYIFEYICTAYAIQDTFHNFYKIIDIKNKNKIQKFFFDRFIKEFNTKIDKLKKKLEEECEEEYK